MRTLTTQEAAQLIASILSTTSYMGLTDVVIGSLLENPVMVDFRKQGQWYRAQIGISYYYSQQAQGIVFDYPFHVFFQRAQRVLKQRNSVKWLHAHW